MSLQKGVLLISLLLAVSMGQQICREEDSNLLNYLKKGMTYQV